MLRHYWRKFIKEMLKGSKIKRSNIIEINDGGGIYPSTKKVWREIYGTQEILHPGMTLRDYFAGKALSSLILAPNQSNADHCIDSQNKKLKRSKDKHCSYCLNKKPRTRQDLSNAAYFYADAMITARSYIPNRGKIND